MLPYLRTALHLDYATASLHLSAFAVTGVPTSLTAAAVHRRIGRVGLVTVGALGVSAGTAMLAAAGSLLVSLIGAGTLGGASVWAYVGLWSGLSDQHGERRTVVLSEGEAAVSAGSLTLPLLIGAAEAVGAGWRTGVLVAALACATMVVGLRSVGGLEAGAPAAARGRLPLGRLWPLLAAAGCCVGLEFTVTTWAAIHLDDDVGLARTTAVAVTSVFFAAMLAGRLGSSVLARRADGRRLLLAALVLLVVVLPVFVLARDAVAAVPALGVCGLATGALFPLISGLVFAAAGAASTRASGAIMLVAAVAVLVAPFAVGALAEGAGLRSALLVATCLPAVAAVLVGTNATNPRRRTRAAPP